MCIRDSVGDASPYTYALTRMLDTALGIVVALVVNLAMPGPKKPAPVSALEDMDLSLIHI